MTPGFALAARYVIHTVGPVWQGGAQGERELLSRCYRRSLRLAADSGLATIAFPAISCGLYRYPPEQAVAVAITAVREQLPAMASIQRVLFCCFSPAISRLYRDAIAAEGSPRRG